MITTDNLTDVIKMITEKEEAMIRKTWKDYVILNLKCFNAGCVLDVSLTMNIYGNKKIREAHNNGGCFLETDEVIRLMDEHLVEMKPSEEEWELNMLKIKTKIGQPVLIQRRFGNYFFDNFLNCLPPIIFGKDFTLSSEPYNYDSKQKAERYIGIFCKDNEWYGTICTIEQFKKMI